MNKDVLILANGPSYNEIDINDIRKKNWKVACVNFFPVKLKNDFFEIKPEYLFLLDGIFFSNETHLKDDVEALKEVIETVTWDMTIVIYQGAWFDISNKKIRFDYIRGKCVLRTKANWLYNKMLDIGVINPGFHSVAVGATFYFIQNNFQNIYMIGVDVTDYLNMHVDENNRVYMESSHSYGTAERLYYDEHKNYGITRMHEWLNTYVLLMREFDILRQYANSKRINVYNYSKKSHVDSFKKIDWNSKH